MPDSQECVGGLDGFVEMIVSPNCLSEEAKSSPPQTDLFVNARRCSDFLPAGEPPPPRQRRTPSRRVALRWPSENPEQLIWVSALVLTPSRDRRLTSQTGAALRSASVADGNVTLLPADISMRLVSALVFRCESSLVHLYLELKSGSAC